MKKIALVLILMLVGGAVSAQAIITTNSNPSPQKRWNEIFIDTSKCTLLPEVRLNEISSDSSQTSPIFPNEIASFLKRNIQYPILALENGIEGTVYMSFVVEKDGSIDSQSIKTIWDIGAGCGIEAVRVVKMKPKWETAMEQSATMVLPIKFEIFTKEEYKSRFEEAIIAGDTISQRKVIRDWGIRYLFDPEVVVAKYNYYYHRARKSFLSIQQDCSQFSNNNYMTIIDSLGNKAYMGEVVIFDSNLVDSAFAVIDGGISRWPNRLDMINGKLHLLRELRRWNSYADNLEYAIITSKKNNNQWVFPGAEEDKTVVFSESIHHYEASLVYAISNIGNLSAEDTLCIMSLRRVAGTMEKMYPRDVVNLNLLAVSYSAMGLYAEALKQFKKAERLDKTDLIVLNNIADMYHNLHKFKQERKYLKKLIKYGDEDTQNQARYLLEQLKNLN